MRKEWPSLGEILATNLTLAMTRQKVSDRVLGSRASLGHKTINNIQNNRHAITLETLEKVASAVDLPAWMLLCPNLPPDELHGIRLLTLIDNYLACDPETRAALDRIVAGQAGAGNPPKAANG